ncbi:hypothetical protein O3P69_016777 [Scylla paramamosain]|uniref:Uncharacterized protein n=1 Tax=Scylla paramamosain TaxID=85552 RepID=A0AAW0SZ60_SCYPA
MLPVTRYIAAPLFKTQGDLISCVIPTRICHTPDTAQVAVKEPYERKLHCWIVSPPSKHINQRSICSEHKRVMGGFLRWVRPGLDLDGCQQLPRSAAHVGEECLERGAPAIYMKQRRTREPECQLRSSLRCDSRVALKFRYSLCCIRFVQA